MNPIAGMVAGLGLTLAGGAALAQDASENRVAVETAWSVFVEDDPRECWLVSPPQSTRNTRNGQVVSVRRGDILLFVSFRPGSNVSGEVSFTGGYPFADGSQPTLEISGDSFDLISQGEWAWSTNEAQDGEIIAAMRGGAEAEVTARSSRGTLTEDTFSLFGFTAALEEAQSRCTS